MVSLMNIPRVERLIRDAIAATGVNLRGLTVLTEAATGSYALTPVIAALAGADAVYALARGTRYGTAAEAGQGVRALAESLGADGVEILTDKYDPQTGRADIVTNLGMLRPLDAPFLARLKATAVIPLMWETWEFRAEDLDLAECRRRGIPVLGTDEHQPALRIFEYVGLLALKLLFECGLEVFRGRIAVLGSGEFAAQAGRAMERAGAEVLHLESGDAVWPDKLLSGGAGLDALCILEHHSRECLIGTEGRVRAEALAEACPGLTVVHVCGGVERAALVSAGLRCAPEVFAPPGSMSVATDYVGPRPLIDLHTAGLRVGEVMARLRLSGLDRGETETRTLREVKLAQAFPDAVEAALLASNASLHDR